ncbi:adenine nucleotide alpha hydrolase [Pseudooceanicola nanhaiensis]|uniref:adenine nucleotide alpha hydrolase n=1 Tax=Pseudooceanicola nanhaiensis TaxID=375761 RepID=UPI001CD6690F|nr:adenine nucleotide alpha hydrolase [Pseudooceanicola nanhaiensis]MCA0920846.1 adenine nucleotide alpha hydrolase [Pseudooceanicola nanhaiensis]
MTCARPPHGTALPAALHAALQAPDRLTIALSGGIDSLTLSAAAALARDGQVSLVHAVSAAVPAAATARVKHFAEARALPLRLVDAGEFADPRYRANPVNRCYFCKSNLYGTLRRLAGDGAIAAGTNLDDLGDYRPGLQAADEHAILHPFVAAEMPKSEVRALARRLGLGDLAELPAAPCLASRIETGLRVEPAELALIDAVESALRDRLGPVTLRCRRLPDALAIEIDAATLAALTADAQAELTAQARAVAAAHAADHLPLRLRAYKRGSAFIHA